MDYFSVKWNTQGIPYYVNRTSMARAECVFIDILLFWKFFGKTVKVIFGPVFGLAYWTIIVRVLQIWPKSYICLRVPLNVF